VISNDNDGSSHRVTTALVRLELCVWKLVCTVLRRLGKGNRSWLLGPLCDSFSETTLCSIFEYTIAQALNILKYKHLRTSIKFTALYAFLFGM
jgi:hypothetical protein